MLLALTQWLAEDVHIRAFNVFNYITLRAVLATLTALLISFIVGPVMIRKLTAYKIGQSVRDDGPKSHLTKAGTPTMGGALILISIAITTLLWADLRNRYVWVVLLVTLGFGIIGWIDDYRKVVHRNPKGLSARKKFFWQSVIGLAAAIYLATSATLPGQTELIVPLFKQVTYPLGIVGFVVMSYFVIVGTSNAVNLTDGLDGLAILPTVMVGSALGVFAYVAGNAIYSRYLGFPLIPGAGELTVVSAASLLEPLRVMSPVAVLTRNQAGEPSTTTDASIASTCSSLGDDTTRTLPPITLISSPPAMSVASTLAVPLATQTLARMGTRSSSTLPLASSSLGDSTYILAPRAGAVPLPPTDDSNRMPLGSVPVTARESRFHPITRNVPTLPLSRTETSLATA